MRGTKGFNLPSSLKRVCSTSGSLKLLLQNGFCKRTAIAAAAVLLCLSIASASSQPGQAAPSGRVPENTNSNVAQQMATARRLLQSGETVKAITLLRGVIQSQPENAGAHLLLGTALVMVPNESEAVEELHRAMQLAPESSRAVYSLGTAYAHFGHLSKAEAAFQKALSLKPKLCRSSCQPGLDSCSAKTTA